MAAEAERVRSAGKSRSGPGGSFGSPSSSGASIRTPPSPWTARASSASNAIIRRSAPDFIFVHYHDDTHQDHRHLSVATITATRYTRNVLFFEGPTTQNFSPSVFVDVDGVLEDKVAALEAHASQVTKTNIEGLTIVDIARASAHFRGIQGRVRNAEAFVPLRLFINIAP